MGNYKEFWNWFKNENERIQNTLETNPDEIAAEIHEHLIKVHPGLVFEIPFAKHNNKFQFIISADGIESVFPEVEKLFGRSPDIKGWEIIKFRPRTYQLTQTVDVDGLSLSYKDVLINYSLNDSYISLNAYIKGYDKKDNRYVHGFFLLLDTLIGEHDAVKKIDEISVHPFDKQKNLFPFHKVIDIIDKKKSD